MNAAMDPELIIRETDDNNTSALSYLLSRAGREVRRGERFGWYASGNPGWGNGVFGLNLADADAATELKKAILSGAVPNMVRTGPSDIPQPIEPFMAENGFTLRMTAAGMALETSAFTYSRRIDAEDFEIREITPAEAAVWAGIVVRNLFRSDSPETAADFASAVLGALSERRMVFFLALMAGVPAGTAAFFQDENSAGVYFVATESTYRNRGIGYEITAAAVSEAVRRSNRLVILQATQLGKPVYEKLGFREVVTLGRWHLPAGENQ